MDNLNKKRLYLLKFENSWHMSPGLLLDGRPPRAVCHEDDHIDSAKSEQGSAADHINSQAVGQLCSDFNQGRVQGRQVWTSVVGIHPFAHNYNQHQRQPVETKAKIFVFRTKSYYFKFSSTFQHLDYFKKKTI